MPWVKGQSGNPGGKHLSPEQKLFVAQCQKNWERAWKIIQNALSSNEWEQQKWGAETLLNRAFGTAVSNSDITIGSNETPGIAELIANLRGLTDPNTRETGESAINSAANSGNQIQ